MVVTQQRCQLLINSGDASKGAYKAGLNWGLLKMMQDIGKIDQTLIGQARDLEPASFSGASAGGINTLLSSLTLCSLPEVEGGHANTNDSNIFRDGWLTPDVNRLLRPGPGADSIYYGEGDAHMSFFKDRPGLGSSARDFNHTSDTRFVIIGLTDLPGLSYWLTR